MAIGTPPPNIRIVEVKNPTGEYIQHLHVILALGLTALFADAMIDQAVEVTTLVLKDGTHASRATLVGL